MLQTQPLQQDIASTLGRIVALANLSADMMESSKGELSYSAAFQLAQMTLRAQERAANQQALADAKLRRAAALREQSEEAASLLQTGLYRVESLPGDMASSAASTAATTADKVELARLKSESRIAAKRRMIDIKRAEAAALARLDFEAAEVSADAKVAKARSKSKSKSTSKSKSKSSSSRDDQGDAAAALVIDTDAATRATTAQLQSIQAQLAALNQKLTAPSQPATAPARRARPPAMTSAQRNDARTRAFKLVDALAASPTPKKAAYTVADTLLSIYGNDVASIVSDIAAMQAVSVGDRRSETRAKFLSRVRRALEKRASIALARVKLAASTSPSGVVAPAPTTAAKAEQPGKTDEAMAAAAAAEADGGNEDGDGNDEEELPEFRLPPVSLLTCEDVSAVSDEQSQAADVLGNKIRATLTQLGLTGVLERPVIGPSVMLYKLRLPEDKATNPKDVMRLSSTLAFATDPSVSMKLTGEARTIAITAAATPTRKVSMCDLVAAPEFNAPNAVLPIVFGKSPLNADVILDLAKMPHMLVAGETGSGKSTFINVLLLSILLKHTPQQCQLVIIDPKRVDTANFEDLPHLYFPLLSERTQVFAALQALVNEMNRRYALLKLQSVVGLVQYNAAAAKAGLPTLPFIVVVFDEFGSFRDESESAKEKKALDTVLNTLAAKSRASGIHLVIATQRPTADVFNSTMKSNIPVRVCFRVTSELNSKVVLGEGGGEKLLGMGDMLIYSAGQAQLTRAQCPYIEDEDIKTVVGFCSAQQPPAYQRAKRTLASLNRSDGDGDGARGVTFAGSRGKSKTGVGAGVGAGAAASMSAPTLDTSAETYEQAQNWDSARVKATAMERIDVELSKFVQRITTATRVEIDSFVLRISAQCHGSSLTSYGLILQRIANYTQSSEQAQELLKLVNERPRRAEQNMENLIRERERERGAVAASASAFQPYALQAIQNGFKKASPTPTPVERQLVARWLFSFPDVSADTLKKVTSGGVLNLAA